MSDNSTPVEGPHEADDPVGAEEELLEESLPVPEEETLEPSDPFFVNKKAAAVLKHGILFGYLPPFASKVGSTSADQRVAVLDGYAGPGRYTDGTLGSPALLAETARTVRDFRGLECHFVEQKRKNYRALKTFLEGEAADLKAVAYRGAVQDHLPSITAATADIPLFAYLDPFGFGLPFDTVVDLLTRNPGGPGYPPTEVMLNFTANGIRRAGGLIKPGRVISPSEAKTLAHADAACGDTWWREIVIQHYLLNDDLEKAVELVAHTYMNRVCRAAKTDAFALDVKNREHHKPVYYLIFFTRHRDGMWLFNNAVSSAQHEWRKHLAPPPWEPDPTLLLDIPREPSFEDEERTRENSWIATLKTNIYNLTGSGEFWIGTKMPKVYEGVLGEAREKHVRCAVKELVKEEKVQTLSRNSKKLEVSGGQGDVPSMKVWRTG